MKTVSISEARNNFAELINQVVYNSQQVVIEKMGKPVAAIVNLKEIGMHTDKSKRGIPPSATAGTLVLPEKLNIEKVFSAIKEPYDKQSLLGR